MIEPSSILGLKVLVDVRHRIQLAQVVSKGDNTKRTAFSQASFLVVSMMPSRSSSAHCGLSVGGHQALSGVTANDGIDLTVAPRGDRAGLDWRPGC